MRFSFNDAVKQLHSISDRLDRRAMMLLFLSGFVIRIMCAFLYGTQDVEWWKAWGTYAVTDTLNTIYGKTDKEVISQFKNGKNLKEVLALTQKVMPYKSYKYFRTEYKLTQPPVYIYSLYASAKLYSVFSPKLKNGRLFNFFVNLQPIIFSLLSALLIGWFVARAASENIGKLAGLIYWLNPLVLLNSPIQGYQDPICVFWVTVAIVALYCKKIKWAVVFLVLAFMTKPQGVLIAPVILFVGICENKLIENIKAWLFGVITAVAISTPFIISRHFLSMVLGVLSIRDSSGDLTRQSMNIWWPLQYCLNAAHLHLKEGMGLISAFLGHSFYVYMDFPISRLVSLTHINISAIGFGLYAVFTIVNLAFLKRSLPYHRENIVFSAALQVYGYFILCPGVQINHYFGIIPLLTLIMVADTANLKYYIAICSVFLLQDLIFYGFGRDFNHGQALLSKLYLAWFTIVLSFANVILFVMLSKACFSRKTVNIKS